MNKSAVTIPDTNIQVLAPVPSLDFFDSQSVTLRRPMSPLDAWRILGSQPMPFLNAALKVRDTISSLFGVRKIGGFSGTIPETVHIGQKLDFFFVEDVSPHVLTLTERDRHLDVMTCISSLGHEVTVTSSVKTHNAFGRLYMIPVAPAHKLIVRRGLKRLARTLP